MRFQKADIAIYFRCPVLICLWRLLKRAYHKPWPISDLPEGCTKTVSFRLVRYLLRFCKRYDASIRMLCEKYPHVRLYTIHSDQKKDQLFKKNLARIPKNSRAQDHS